MAESTEMFVGLVYLTIATVPGLAIGSALGLRGWLLAAVAPLLTFGLVGAAGSALPLLGVLWSPAAFGVVVVVVAGAVRGLRLIGHRRRPDIEDEDPGDGAGRWSVVHHAGVLTAVLIAAIVGLTVVSSATAGFTAVPQIWDAVFHANATRYIAATGESDPAALRNLNDAVTADFYYPNAYHVVAATVVMITGAAVPTVLDISVAIFPVMLALGMAALVRQVGGRPALAAAAAVLSCAFTAFPYDLLPWGTLLPFITAVALIPSFLALFATVLQHHRRTVVALPVALGVAGIGLLGLHPSGAIAAAMLGLGLLVHVWWSRRPSLGDLRAFGLVAGAAAVLGGPLLLASAGAAAGTAYDHPATLMPGDAMGQVLFLSHGRDFPQYWLVALGVFGMFRTATLRPVRWFVLVGVVFAGLFVAAAAYEGDLVALLTQAWWNDRWRFAALWTLGAILLAAAGLVGVRDVVGRAAVRLLPSLAAPTERRRVAGSSALLALVVAAVAFASDGLYRDRNVSRLSEAFSDGPSISSDERLAFDRLAELVPEGSMVMNDPYDGSAMMWALADVRPVFATPIIPPRELPTMEPNRRMLIDSFDELDRNEAVRLAVDELGIDYVIICTGFIGPASSYVAGMQDVPGVAGLELVYENPDARIYAITGRTPDAG